MLLKKSVLFIDNLRKSVLFIDNLRKCIMTIYSHARLPTGLPTALKLSLFKRWNNERLARRRLRSESLQNKTDYVSHVHF